MTEIEVGGYRLLCDVQTTRACYAESNPIRCDCIECQNFWAQQDKLLAGELGELLDRFGIDRDKPAEVYSYGPLDDAGTRRYEGWYHFVGKLVTDSGIEPLNGNTEVYFSSGASLAHRPFRDRSLVSVEFQMLQVPWVLNLTGGR